MTPRDFCYWLQGLFELDNLEGLSQEQVKKIKAKLDSCFVHEAMQVENVIKPLKPGTDASDKFRVQHGIVYKC